MLERFENSRYSLIVVWGLVLTTFLINVIIIF